LTHQSLLEKINDPLLVLLGIAERNIWLLNLLFKEDVQGVLVVTTLLLFVENLFLVLLVLDQFAIVVI